MKILSITRNDANQLVAEVLDCGRTVRIAAYNPADLAKSISHTCHFSTPLEVRMDIELNYPEFAAP